MVDEAVYHQRLQRELDVIVGMKFPGYFLIVWDFIREAKERGIPVGPGRGSGAGSIVAYSLGITDIDPLPYNLLFERFLNPERVSMPDFDVDFCMARRDEVIEYVSQRYGEQSVGQIATFQNLKARSVIKDVARAMGMPAPEAQRIASLVPDKGQGKTYTIEEALEVEPKLKALHDSDPRDRGAAAASQEARGPDASRRHARRRRRDQRGPALRSRAVLQERRHDRHPVRQGRRRGGGPRQVRLPGPEDADGDRHRREAGQRAARSQRQAALAVQDRARRPRTYALVASGETTGVFQLESSGMQQLLRGLKPDCFEDIVAAVALYRPGPLGTGMIDDFVASKHGKKAIRKLHPLIDDVLAPTYGVLVYQEQVMQIAQQLAGYSLGGADLLRRAMGKKKAEEMEKQLKAFIDGALARGVSEEQSTAIFNEIEGFAAYGFNKSHSAAYALITYQTAYLKAHYPVSSSPR